MRFITALTTAAVAAAMATSVFAYPTGEQHLYGRALSKASGPNTQGPDVKIKPIVPGSPAPEIHIHHSPGPQVVGINFSGSKASLPGSGTSQNSQSHTTTASVPKSR